MIDSIPHCHAEMLWKETRTKKCLNVSMQGTKLEFLSSNVFQTVILKMLLKEAKIKKYGFVSI